MGSWDPPVVVGTAFDRLAIEPDMARLVMAGAPLPRDRGAKAVSRAGRNYITKRWERAGETAGGREASDAGGSRKKNKTETNLGKGACQTARSGLRILQAGRFVIEAAFLIPADWRGLAWALMPISKKLKFARAPAATAETRVTTAATASRRFAIFRIRTWASRPRRPHAAVARSLHVLVRKP